MNLQIVLFCLSLYQSDTLKISVFVDKKEPLPGVIAYLKNSDPKMKLGGITDIDGYTEIPLNPNFSVLSLSGGWNKGPLEIELKDEIDSITIHITKKRILFFHEGKKVDKRNL